MAAGSGGDDGDAALTFAYKSPREFAGFIDTLVEATATYLIAQVKAGAEALQIFESWAGTIPAQCVGTYSVEPIRRIVARVRAETPDVPIIIFPRGAGSELSRYAETGANAISIDTHTSLTSARKAMGNKTVLQGNLDPLALINGGETLTAAVRAILDETRDSPHIFNLGHGIRPETPIAHVEQLLKLLRNAA
jgi:uroporphyrinogen decarboxylase